VSTVIVNGNTIMGQRLKCLSKKTGMM